MSSFALVPEAVRAALIKTQGELEYVAPTRGHIESVVNQALLSVHETFGTSAESLARFLDSHLSDFDSVTDYANACVEQVATCMNIYDAASHQMGSHTAAVAKVASDFQRRQKVALGRGATGDEFSHRHGAQAVTGHVGATREFHGTVVQSALSSASSSGARSGLSSLVAVGASSIALRGR